MLPLFSRPALILDKYTVFWHADEMQKMPAEIWIAACAHRLHHHWHTVDPRDLEQAARDIWNDERFGELSPDTAAAEWLKPLACLEQFQGTAPKKS